MIKFATFFLITIFLSTTAITTEKYPFQAGQGFDTKYLWEKNLNGKKKWLLPKKMLKDQFLAKLLARMIKPNFGLQCMILLQQEISTEMVFKIT